MTSSDDSPGPASEAQLAAELRAALRLIGTTNVIAAPVSHSRLLGMVVQTAAHVLQAKRGSLLLIDEARKDLVFVVATPESSVQLERIRVPLGQGIAGLVALTGQPLAVADASSDPRHATEIAQRIGYTPTSLLCVPLAYDDTVIGVLELLDKEGGFDAADIDALTLFAAQAAIAIEQSRAQRNLAALLRELLTTIGDEHHVVSTELLDRVEKIAGVLELEPMFRRAVEMAGLVHQLAAAGEAESELCLTTLRAVHKYARATREHYPA